jgi:hypothetical protein
VSEQPVAGSLSARIIRACTVHAECPLECPERKVEELGTIASFDHNFSIKKRLKESYFQWRHSAHPSEKPS